MSVCPGSDRLTGPSSNAIGGTPNDTAFSYKVRKLMRALLPCARSDHSRSAFFKSIS